MTEDKALPPPLKRGEGHEDTPHVTILLSVHNGEAYIEQQLASFLNQSWCNWSLLWRDDASTDSSRALMHNFQMQIRSERCREADGTCPQPRAGIVDSYLRLLNMAPESDFIAFSDQDDVWLKNKLLNGVKALSKVQPDVPALYCARQTLTDCKLSPKGPSPALPHLPVLMTSLAGNFATGCTIMINNAARKMLLRHQPPPENILHDWWACLLISATGGTVITDQEQVILYRQHNRNAIGARPSFIRRAYGAIRRGPGAFMKIFHSNIDYLLSCSSDLPPETVVRLQTLKTALRGNLLSRMNIPYLLPDLKRNNLAEQFIFRLWLLLG